MGRNQRPGISFYRVDCDHYADKGIRLLMNEFGADGYFIYRCLVDYGHKEWGYYFDLKDKEALELFASDECRMKLTLVEQVILGCIRRSLFDKTVADMFGKLTNADMQEVFILGTADRRDKGSVFEMQEEWLLLPPDKIDRRNLRIVQPKKKIHQPNNSQSKEEKSKEEKRKTTAQAPAADTPEPESILKLVSRILGADFVPDWESWKLYRLKEHRFKYKAYESEHAAFSKLRRLSEGKADIARAIMLQSKENGWKGFFELDTPRNLGGPSAPKVEAIKKDVEHSNKQLEKTIEYLYDVFQEDQSKVTILSIDPTHYNHLKITGIISFSDEKGKEIRTMAITALQAEGKPVSNEPDVMIRMKKIAVLEMFKQYEKEGKETIFN